MLTKYTEFLAQINFWPVNSQIWNIFELNHIPPGNENQRVEVEKQIGSMVDNKAGIYIYQSLDNRILYRESFVQVPGDTKDQKWHRFFVNNQGMIRIYWKQLDGEENRKIIEIMLEYLLEPEFR